MKQIKVFCRRDFNEEEINDFILKNDFDIEKITLKQALRCDGDDGVVDGGEFITNIIYNTDKKNELKKFIKYFKTQIDIENKINAFIEKHSSIIIDDIVIDISQRSRNNAWNIGYIVYQSSSPIKD